ncbi:MAG TPA: hydroxymethylbilane synthase [Bacteroidota bacterium]|nr:hydroxymethylbilane synthase [Bacteroidota bacterium]
MRAVIGTRGSPLALWQSNYVRNELLKLYPGMEVGIEIIKTTGDAIPEAPLSKIGSKGLFTKEIDRALLDRRVDLAVHSLKDMPTVLPEGLAVGAVTVREDVRDVFIAHPGKPAKRIDDLPHGATIATGSLRRTCQLLRWRPDLLIVDLRGNLNTRLEKLDLSDWHGIILAKAGVVRLGARERISETIPVERILPAVGQGALCIEVRADDGELINLVKPLNSEAARIATDGERALLRVLEGGCQVPVGAYGRIERNEFFLDAIIGSLDGGTIVRGQEHGPPAQSVALGQRLGKTILERGGRELLETMRNPNLQQAPEV